MIEVYARWPMASWVVFCPWEGAMPLSLLIRVHTLLSVLEPILH